MGLNECNETERGKWVKSVTFQNVERLRDKECDRYLDRAFEGWWYLRQRETEETETWNATRTRTDSEDDDEDAGQICDKRGWR